MTVGPRGHHAGFRLGRSPFRMERTISAAPATSTDLRSWGLMPEKASPTELMIMQPAERLAEVEDPCRWNFQVLLSAYGLTLQQRE